MSKANKKKLSNESSLSSHKRHKKELIPPFLQVPNLTLASWANDRLPEMLWAVLVVSNLERNKALYFFRDIGQLVCTNQEYSDITLTGIGKLPKESARFLIKYMLDWSEEIPIILRPLRLYSEIPAYDIWSELLEEPIPETDWDILSVSVQNAFFHQSQEATDCRWMRVYCLINGGKLHFCSGMEDLFKEIDNYPHNGDLKKVRPLIRAMEGSVDSLDDKDLTWPKGFWNQNHTSTICIPHDIATEKIKIRTIELSQESKNTRKYFVDETSLIMNKIVSYFFESEGNTRIVPRHETSFGLVLYGMSLFIEMLVYGFSNSIIGRLALRSLVEIYITFEYLLKKEQELPQIWDDFYDYGTGQTKLIYLKLKELPLQSSCIELEELDFIINEDKDIEFIPIKLGQWGKSDLRTMSEYADVKDIYDIYYNYTSGFVHGTRGAIRESVYQMCSNPLHRYHRIPTQNLSLMPSVTLDFVIIVNKILDCLNLAYPIFDSRIDLPEYYKLTKSEEK